MKKHLYTIAFLAFTITLATTTAAADVKIKTRQTVSGQSYENTTYIKGKRSRAENMGGAMISITQCDLRRNIQLSPATRTYMINEFAQAVQAATASAKTSPEAKQDVKAVVQSGGRVTTTITIKDTGERKQMFGYTARHLIITMETVSSPDSCSPTNSKMQMDGWYVDAEFALDCDFGYQASANPSGKKGGCQDRYEIKQIGAGKRGYPLYEKMTMFDESGKESFSTVSEVIELSKATLEASLFEIPADYRQVADATQMYASAASVSTRQLMQGMDDDDPATPQSGTVKSIKNAAAQSPAAVISAGNVGPKKAGTIRIGLAGVKTGAVGDGLTASDLAAAVQNTLVQYLKVPNIEIVPLEAKLSSAIDGEAKQKECDFVIHASVSHKKGGGGGFGGMFGSAVGTALGRTGIGSTGSVAGNIAGQVATEAIVTAATVSANVKAKDQITLDIKLQQPGGAAVVTKQFVAKAKSNGDDIISQVVEQAAEAIVSSITAGS